MSAPGGVRKAVIPAAGLATRMRPATLAVPKELLPVGRQPMIQHAVDEALASGIAEICVVIRAGKESIRDYLTAQYAEPARRASAAGAGAAAVGRLTFVYQARPAGLGDALLQAREFVAGEPFVMLVPDQLLHGPAPATAQLLQRWRPGPAVWSSVLRLPPSETEYFVGARGFDCREGPEPGVYLVDDLRGEAETRAADRARGYEVRGFGRTVYPAAIFDYLGEDYVNPATGEVDLLRTFRAAVGPGRALAHYAVLLEGEAFDLGTFPGYYRYLPRLWELTRA